MKITSSDLVAINKVRLAGITIMNENILEKDILVTRAISLIANLSAPKAKLVFCGGTCLSKAHQAIQRMSEDIDFKIMIEEELNYSQRVKHLKTLKECIFESLIGAGFDTSQIICKNKNAFISGLIPYESSFTKIETVLRKDIKIDFTAINPKMTPVMRPIRPIVDELMGDESRIVSVPCQDVRETMLEKITAMFRRIDDDREKFSKDPYLMRHIYDVAQIIPLAGEITEEMQRIFNAKIDADRMNYCGHCYGFATDPKYNMACTLDKLRDEPFYADAYMNNIRGMTFVEDRPSYANALQKFAEIGDKLVSGYVSDPTVEEEIENRLERIGNGEDLRRVCS